MIYVYSRYIGTGPQRGREDFVQSYESESDAVKKIAQCYRIDSNTCQLGEYYYFMKEH